MDQSHTSFLLVINVKGWYFCLWNWLLEGLAGRVVSEWEDLIKSKKKVHIAQCMPNNQIAGIHMCCEIYLKATGLPFIPNNTHSFIAPVSAQRPTVWWEKTNVLPFALHIAMFGLEHFHCQHIVSSCHPEHHFIGLFLLRLSSTFGLPFLTFLSPVLEKWSWSYCQVSSHGFSALGKSRLLWIKCLRYASRLTFLLVYFSSKSKMNCRVG